MNNAKLVYIFFLTPLQDYVYNQNVVFADNVQANSLFVSFLIFNGTIQNGIQSYEINLVSKKAIKISLKLFDGAFLYFRYNNTGVSSNLKYRTVKEFKTNFFYRIASGCFCIIFLWKLGSVELRHCKIHFKTLTKKNRCLVMPAVSFFTVGEKP